MHYAGSAEAWIQRFKYPARGLAARGRVDPAASAVLRSWVSEAARRLPDPAPALLVPIPLHAGRLRERGFNPAAELAAALSRSRALELDATALHRTRATASQVGLSRRQRRLNVKGVFSPRPGLRLPPRVCLVDDVVTTGSTLGEAARVLRRIGARQVVAICAARTPGVGSDRSGACKVSGDL